MPGHFEILYAKDPLTKTMAQGVMRNLGKRWKNASGSESKWLIDGKV